MENSRNVLTPNRLPLLLLVTMVLLALMGATSSMCPPVDHHISATAVTHDHGSAPAHGNDSCHREPLTATQNTAADPTGQLAAGSIGVSASAVQTTSASQQAAADRVPGASPGRILLITLGIART